MTESERREADRIEFESRVLIKTEDGIVEGTADSRNISLKGIYVQPERNLPTGTACLLDITLTGQASTMKVTIPGQICRHDEKGTGIAFTNMEMDTFVHIKTLINLNNP